MHDRNRHRQGYDFAVLVARSPELKRFVAPARHGEASIDFADSEAVKALNRALLKTYYGIAEWDIPPGYLCPPIPGRADYLHYAADLLAADHGGAIPRGPGVRVLDLGVGANCIYPILGRAEYGWEFVGTEVDRGASQHAQSLVRRNPLLEGHVECRWQRSAQAIFRGVVHPAERFALSLCNPPFHASAQAAATGTRRKLQNLHGTNRRKLALNFGGTPTELWCPGGERAFIRQMIAESVDFGAQCGWFTTLVSKSAHLPAIEQALRQMRAAEVRTIEMAQGQKKSRIVAWRF